MTQLQKQESDPEISKRIASALPTERDDWAAREPSAELVDQNELTDSTVAILELQVLDSEAKTLVIDKMAQESTDHPGRGYSTLLTEDVLIATDTSPQDQAPSEAQAEGQFSKVNQDLDSVSHQDTSTQSASDSDVAPSVQKSAIVTIDSTTQLIPSDETAERISEPDVTKTERDESIVGTESNENEKADWNMSELEEGAATESASLELSREELAHDVESLSELSDLAEQDVTTIAKEQTHRVPVYRPLAPIAATIPMRARSSTNAASASTNNTDLRLRLQLLFGRGGDVKLNLVADRREHMPDEVEVSLTQGKLLLLRHRKLLSAC